MEQIYGIGFKIHPSLSPALEAFLSHGYVTPSLPSDELG